MLTDELEENEIDKSWYFFKVSSFLFKNIFISIQFKETK